MFFCKKSRSLTFLAEGYLTRAVTIIALSSHDCYKIFKEEYSGGKLARRWSWTIFEVEFYFLIMQQNTPAAWLAAGVLLFAFDF
jgi:hypothetical protein